MGTKLYVGNLNYNTTEQSLREAFGADGRDVASVSIIMDRETGRPRGFAFVEMATDEGAKQALAALDGQELDGRMLRINEAREREARGAGGPRPAGAGYSPRPSGPPGGGGYAPRPSGPPGSGGFGAPRPSYGGGGGAPGGFTRPPASAGGGFRGPGGGPPMSAGERRKREKEREKRESAGEDDRKKRRVRDDDDGY